MRFPLLLVGIAVPNILQEKALPCFASKCSIYCQLFITEIYSSSEVREELKCEPWDENKEKKQQKKGGIWQLNWVNCVD